MKVELRKIRSENQARYWASRLVCELEKLREEDAISDDNHRYCWIIDGDVVVMPNDLGTLCESHRLTGFIDIETILDNPYWDRYDMYDILEGRITALAKSLMWLAARKEFRDALHATKFSPSDVDAAITAWLAMDIDAENYYLGEYLAEMCGVFRGVIDTDTLNDMRKYAYDHGMII